MENQTKNLLKFFILPLSLITIVVVIISYKFQPDYLLHLDFLDVGQGDAIFIQTHLGKQILIDGGPSDKVLSELGEVMPFYDHSIDLLILTHPDADHVTGLAFVLKRFDVKQVLVTGVESETAVYKEFARLLEEKKVEKIYAHQGQRVWFDKATVLDIYSPVSQPKEVSKTANNTSIFGKLIFGKTKVLFTGDADSIVEDVALDHFNLDADILKVGHHGSRYSTSEKFLKEVTPEYAVIQVGAKNNYGHPTQEVLDKLNVINSKIFRNDQDGLVQFTSNGSDIYKK